MGERGRYFETNPRGRALLGEYHDDLQVQFFGGVADGFSDDFIDLQIAGARGAGQLRDTGFGFANDAVHHHDGFQRIEAGGGFAGKHEGVAAVENGVGDVRCFGARGTRIFLHGIEHLGGGDYGDQTRCAPSE